MRVAKKNALTRNARDFFSCNVRDFLRILSAIITTSAWKHVFQRTTTPASDKRSDIYENDKCTMDKWVFDLREPDFIRFHENARRAHIKILSSEEDRLGRKFLRFII